MRIMQEASGGARGGRGRGRGRGFTLIELLVVVAVIAVLIAILLPALSSARKSAFQVKGLSNMRQLAAGWHIYSAENDEVILPGRFPALPGGMANPANFFDVGNGKKFRARFLPVLGKYTGLFAFVNPDKTNDRQDLDGEVFRCPAAAERTDEGNCAFGYNYQFLGNPRLRSGVYRNFPLKQTRLQTLTRTVMFADALGTAAGYGVGQRLAYSNNGTDLRAVGNHAWSLDPPRLTASSDRGTGNAGSPRSAVDARHSGRANTVFCDGHGGAYTPGDLGYRTNADGSFRDSGPGSDTPPTNELFSGSGTDKDPV
ncbi:MAG: prepilin-type N-terminal cleavage/methylation domain-containing protein [Planctomycetota bacterium]|nr:prepilin-type N-terminal cleavage/methylation domain-containing protein [Planctomycetota bacterium]